MSTFEDLEKVFETKYSANPGKDPKLLIRRDCLLAYWMAERINIPNIEQYAIEIINADIASDDHDGVVRKISEDLTIANKELPIENINILMDELLEQAKKQISESN